MRWLRLLLLAVVGLLMANVCGLLGHAVSSASTTAEARSDGTISGTVFIGRAKQLLVPSASVTLRSQGGTTRTAKASQDGTFRLQVPAENWQVVRVTPPGFSQFCATPTTIRVLAHHTISVKVQVACASSVGGGGFLSPPP